MPHARKKSCASRLRPNPSEITTRLDKSRGGVDEMRRRLPYVYLLDGVSASEPRTHAVRAYTITWYTPPVAKAMREASRGVLLLLLLLLLLRSVWVARVKLRATGAMI